MSAQFRTHKVCKEKTAKAKSLSLWFLPALLISLLCTSSITTISHPPNHTHYHSAPFLLLCREMSRLKEEGQEDEVAWEGLSPNKSICFLVCPLNWLLAPAQLLHSLQPDTKNTNTYTQLDSTHQNQNADRLKTFCKAFF